MPLKLYELVGTDESRPFSPFCWRTCMALAHKGLSAETIQARPATMRAYALAKEVNPNFGQPAIRTEEERKLLFGQTAAVVR